jgi:hypothetical protein
MTGRDARPTKVVRGSALSSVAWASVPGKLWFQFLDSVTVAEYVAVFARRSTKFEQRDARLQLNGGIMIEESAVIHRLESHQWRETEDGRILVFPRYKGERPDFHGFYELGEFEAMVWRLMATPQTVGQICQAISHQLSELGDVEIPEGDELITELSAFVMELQENSLIRIETKAP